MFKFYQLILLFVKAAPLVLYPQYRKAQSQLLHQVNYLLVVKQISLACFHLKTQNVKIHQ